MERYVVRTDSQRDDLIDIIKSLEPPYVALTVPIYPKATKDQYRYLFGVVYEAIADFAGYPSVWEVHEKMMEHYGVEYCPVGDGEWGLIKRSASTFSTVSITQYIEMIRAEWLIDCNLEIEDPF